MQTVKTVCPYCGVGCGMTLSVEENRVTHVVGDKNHPANFGRLCTKGLTVDQTIHSSDRLYFAQTRESRNSPFSQMDINEALDRVADRIRETVDRYGPDSFAMYVSGQISTEAQYAANKFCKGFLRTNNIDSNSRLCMASAASGYKLSLGADAPPGCYEDIEHANLFFIIGSNMADCHPVLFLRVLDQQRKNGARIIVVDPRKNATAQKADLYLQIKPGTDLALLNGLLNLLILNNWIDEEFINENTEGWDELRRMVIEYTPERVSEITGISIESIETTARWMGESKAWMSFWTMGLNQSAKGTWQTNAVCNLHLATGAICRPGSGPFSLTGQPNAMGGREVGYLSQGLPGQRAVTSGDDRSFIENVWNLEPGSIRSEPGLDTVRLFKALESGDVKTVWIIGTNPVATVSNRSHVIEGLKKAEFVIVQDAYHPTETTQYADILLPGALWAEAEGTMVNSERMVTLMQQALQPNGDTQPDWKIITAVAQRMGGGHLFPYSSAEDIFNEIRMTYNERTGYDLRGMSYNRLREQSLQWGCPSEESSGTLRKYITGYREDEKPVLRFATESGKANFFARPHQEAAETTGKDHPFILTNGRLPHQWHTRTKTGKVAALNRLNPSPFIEINTSDATRLGIGNNQRVRVESARGSFVYPASITDSVPQGVGFAPFHWNDLYGEEQALNQVTNDARDPVSLQPEFKYAAVNFTKVESSDSKENQTMLMQMDASSPKAEDQGTFTDEQKEYLQGLMAGAAQRGLALPGQAGTAAAKEEEEKDDSVFGTPIDELSKEERIKLEQNGLDVWGKIVKHAEEGKFPQDGDVFRFKFHGMFYVAPAQDAFMLRCRIPAGIVTANQLRGLADIAENWGGGYADVTTRANFQIREINAKNTVNVLTKLYDIGLTSKGSGADNIRNVTASPTSGIDPNEVYDVRPLAKALHHYILNHRDLYGLPRKFNVAFDNGGSVSVVSDTNDIGFLAVRVGEGHDVEPGVYFRVLLGGITGHCDFAKDCGVLIKPGECLPVTVAMIQVFIENGDRTNRKKARLKYVLDRWGVEKFLDETQKKLPFKFVRFPYEKCKPRRHVTKHGHIGEFKQSQAGLNYIGVAIPVGRMKVRQLRQIADIAEKFGSGDVRLTVWQNLIIPNIRDEDTAEVRRQIRNTGFDYRSTSISGGLVACTGNTGCKFAATNTKGQAIEIARYLEKKVTLDQPINIHLTGCPHSCAQHYCGDIGLLGMKVTEDGNSVEGYNIVLGGGVDQEQGIAKDVFRNIPFSRVPGLLEKVVNTYLAKRNAGESFVEFTRRHEVKELQEIFSD